MSAEEDFKRELPHILVLAVLLLVLLIVVTKFKWIHCSQVPGDWCNVYCSINGKSRVAIVSGENGTGNPSALFNLTTNIRQNTYLEPYPANEISASLLSNYELVVFERMREVTPRQVSAILQYADRGGSILWVGDAGVEQRLSADDLAEAKIKNESDPGYYEDFVEEYNKSKEGFGRLEALFRVSFQHMENGTSLRMKVADRNSLMMKGLNQTFDINAKQFAKVNADVSKSALVASVYGTSACTFDSPCPALVANKYAAWMVYISFPPEQIKSQTALNNIFDFLVTC